MKFLIDAQLPRRVAVWLIEAGHDAKHTLDLPMGNRTPDHEVIACAMRESRIVVSKDSDFVQAFLITGQPPLLLIATGNIANAALEKLIRANLSEIERAFEVCRFAEINNEVLVVHE